MANDLSKIEQEADAQVSDEATDILSNVTFLAGQKTQVARLLPCILCFFFFRKPNTHFHVSRKCRRPSRRMESSFRTAKMFLKCLGKSIWLRRYVVSFLASFVGAYITTFYVEQHGVRFVQTAPSKWKRFWLWFRSGLTNYNPGVPANGLRFLTLRCENSVVLVFDLQRK